MAFLTYSNYINCGRFLHIAFRAPKQAFHEQRVKIGWSIMRRRHPLLMSKVLVYGDDLNAARFSSVSTANVEVLCES